MDFIKASVVYYDTLINLERIVEVYHKEEYEKFKSLVIRAIEDTKINGGFNAKVFFNNDLPIVVQNMFIKELQSLGYKSEIKRQAFSADMPIKSYLYIDWDQKSWQ